MEQNRPKNALLLGLAGALLAAFQILKGLGLQPHVYGLLPYLATYHDGLLRRALLPSLFQFLGVADLNGIAQILSALHILALTLLATYLAGCLIYLSGWRRVLALGVLASSILPIVAALNGYADVFILLALAGAAELLRRQRVITAVMLLLLMGLQHELALVLGFILLLGQCVLQPARRIYLATAIFLIFSAAFLLISAQAQTALAGELMQRCQLYQPHDAIFGQVWNDYCTRVSSISIMADFLPLRAILLPLYLPVSGLFFFLLFAGAGMVARQNGKQLGLLVSLLLAPFGLIFFMWDADRVFVLAMFTNWLILDSYLGRYPQPLSENRQIQAIFAAFLAFQVVLTYPAIDNYAYQRVIQPAVSERLFISPRAWVLPWLGVMHAPPPQALTDCVDIRCRNSGRN